MLFHGNVAVIKNVFAGISLAEKRGEKYCKVGTGDHKPVIAFGNYGFLDEAGISEIAHRLGERVQRSSGAAPEGVCSAGITAVAVPKDDVATAADLVEHSLVDVDIGTHPRIAKNYYCYFHRA